MFSKILSKDFKSLSRQKRGITIAILPMLVAVFAIIYTVVLYFILKYVNLEGLDLEDIGFGKLNYTSSSFLFQSFASTYGIIIIAIMAGGLISTEIKNKQWILPLNAGHSSKKLFLSKLISTDIWVLGSMLIGILVHFLFTIIFCKPAGGHIWQVLALYLFLLLIIVLFVNIIISLNFLTKNSWVGILVILACLILLPSIFAEIKIGSNIFLDYTPLSFLSINPFRAENFLKIFTTSEWISVIISYFVLFFGFPLWAISSSKIKAKK